MSSELTPLERKCIELVAARHFPGFRTDGFRVVRRENTGVGRFVCLVDVCQQKLRDGVYEAGGHIVEMVGLRLGLNFAVSVDASHVSELEIVTPGNDGWDGVERDWKVV